MNWMIDLILIFLFLFLLICLWAAVFDSNRFVTVTYDIEAPKLKKDCKIVFLSDLHNKCYGSENKKLVEAIQKESPDLILIGGDLLTAKAKNNKKKKKKDTSGHAIELLSALQGKYPIYYAYGNHEDRAGRRIDRYGDLWTKYLEAVKDYPITFLNNQHETIEEYGLSIYGYTMPWEYYKKFIPRVLPEEEMPTALGKAKEDTFNILLAHNPEFFPSFRKWNPDLTLAGHVHGGVMRLPFIGGVISPSFRIFPHYDGGVFQEEGKQMIISRGLGSHTIPIRIFNPGELVVLQLHSLAKNEKSL